MTVLQVARAGRRGLASLSKALVSVSPCARSLPSLWPRSLIDSSPQCLQASSSRGFAAQVGRAGRSPLGVPGLPRRATDSHFSLSQAASNEEDYKRFAGDASRKHVTVRLVGGGRRQAVPPTLLLREGAI